MLVKLHHAEHWTRWWMLTHGISFCGHHLQNQATLKRGWLAKSLCVPLAEQHAKENLCLIQNKSPLHQSWCVSPAEIQWWAINQVKISFIIISERGAGGESKQKQVFLHFLFHWGWTYLDVQLLKQMEWWCQQQQQQQALVRNAQG